MEDGVAQGETIGIVPALNPESLISILAAASLGVAHPVNILSSPEAMASQFRALGVRRIVALGANPTVDPAGRLEAQGFAAEAIIEIPVTPAEVRHRNWSDFVSGRKAVMPPQRSADDPALVFGTGGTTGAPKLAQLSTANILAAAGALAEGAGIGSSDRVLSGLPLFHVGGLIDTALAALLQGGTIVFPTAFGMRNPRVLDATWKLIDDACITIAALVPTSISAALNVPRGNAKLTTLRGVLTGSSPIALEVAYRLEAHAGVPLVELYGMTETAGITSCNSFADRKLGTTGRPVDCVEISIGAPDSGHDRFKQGEIFVKGPNVFLGYTDPAVTAEVLRDGWLATGDLGQFDGHGRLIVNGRSRDIIIRGGHNIDPVMIEACAVEHPDVLHAAAVGFPDDYAGELPVLYVALKPERQTDAETIRAFVGQRVNEPPARPKRVFILDAMPMTPMGKIYKPALRQDAAARAAAGEAL